MNLLFTSAGRRGYLLDMFRAASSQSVRIHAANSGPCSAFRHADQAVLSPEIYSADYIPFLEDYCLRNHIAAIIPLFDIDLPVLAAAKQRFREFGVQIIVSSEQVTRLANDKLASHHFLIQHGLASPRTLLSLADARAALLQHAVSFPLVVKPRWGMGSIGLSVASNMQELEVLYAMTLRAIKTTYLRHEAADSLDEAVLIQQCLTGVEFGLDVINDLDGKYLTTITKRKLAMRSGETDVATTVSDATLTDLGRRLGLTLRHAANLDVDVFRDDDTGQLFVLEFNARFGGGYPFSHLAGVDLPRAILAWIQAEPHDPSWLHFESGVTSEKDISVARME